jgi:4-aminobutyrate aminotransferase/(S)-3-amino-2-methylpropionate transaminase
MALSLTSKTTPYKRGFLPLAPEVYRVPYAYPYRPPVEPKDGESFGEACAALLDKAFAQYVAAEDVAALIVEPVQGEGGFVVPPDDYLPALKRRCEEHGIVFIADEVQTGFGRTGKMFAVEHSGVVPHLVVLAKSIAAGFPLSAVVGQAKVVDAPAEAMDMIGDVRGLGAMSAVEFVRDRGTKEPAKGEAGEILKWAARRGVLVLSAGVWGNCVRFLAPLVITDEQLDEALDVLEVCVREVAGSRAASAAGALADPT